LHIYQYEWKDEIERIRNLDYRNQTKAKGLKCMHNNSGDWNWFRRWGERKEDINVQTTIWAYTAIFKPHAPLHEIQGRVANRIDWRRKIFHRRMTPHAPPESTGVTKRADAPVRSADSADASAQSRHGQLLNHPCAEFIYFVVSGATNVITHFQKY